MVILVVGNLKLCAHKCIIYIIIEKLVDVVLETLITLE